MMRMAKKGTWCSWTVVASLLAMTIVDECYQSEQLTIDGMALWLQTSEYNKKETKTQEPTEVESSTDVEDATVNLQKRWEKVIKFMDAGVTELRKADERGKKQTNEGENVPNTQSQLQLVNQKMGEVGAYRWLWRRREHWKAEGVEVILFVEHSENVEGTVDKVEKIVEEMKRRKGRTYNLRAMSVMGTEMSTRVAVGVYVTYGRIAFTSIDLQAQNNMAVRSSGGEVEWLNFTEVERGRMEVCVRMKKLLHMVQLESKIMWPGKVWADFKGGGGDAVLFIHYEEEEGVETELIGPLGSLLYDIVSTLCRVARRHATSNTTPIPFSVTLGSSFTLEIKSNEAFE